MTFLLWTLVILITLALALLIYFLFFILLPSIQGNNTDANDSVLSDPVFSDIERNYVIAKDDDVPESEKKAFVMCSSSKTFNCEKNTFNEGQSCLLVNSIFGSGNDCKFSCLGLGDCVKACPQNAIFIENNTAVVSNLCIGCGLCIPACPKGVIKLINKTSKTQTVCCNKNAEDALTTCSGYKKDENVQRTDKKGFKIWVQCYKILKLNKKNR